jgi:hypothetical protein
MLWLGEKRFQNKGNTIRLTDKLLSEINDVVDSIAIPLTATEGWHPATLEVNSWASWATTAGTIEAQPYTQYITANSSTEGTYEATGI